MRLANWFKVCCGSVYWSFLVSIAVIAGLATIILAEPFISTSLLVACAGYFGYRALRIAFAGAKVSFIKIRAPGFITGMTLQFIKPQAYAVHTTFLLDLLFIQIVL